MQQKLKDGSVMISGTCGRDAELKRVGQKDSRVCSVSVAVGKRVVEGSDKPDTIWCNLKAWHTLAEVLASAQKGDSVFAVGRLESREHEGKIYTDLVAEYVSLATLYATQPLTAYDTASSQDALAKPYLTQNLSPYRSDPGPIRSELTDDDGELPF